MTWTWLGICVAVFLAMAGLNGYRRGFIKEVVSMFFVFLAIALVWVINPYVNDFLKKNTPVYEKIQETCEELVNVSDREGEQTLNQNDFIENLALPQFLKSSLEQNNTADVYHYLSADTFAEYVSGYLAVTLFNGLSFVVSYLLATLLIRMITYALDIIARLPIIKGANKLMGAVVGCGKGIMFVWIAFLILTVFCSTEIGKKGIELIEQDSFLSLLNNNNIFVKIFMNIFYGK